MTFSSVNHQNKNNLIEIIQEIICKFARTDFDLGLKIWFFFDILIWVLTFWPNWDHRFLKHQKEVRMTVEPKPTSKLKCVTVMLRCDKLCLLRYKNFAKFLKDLSTSNNFTFLLFQVRKYGRHYISNKRRFSIFKWRVHLNIKHFLILQILVRMT